MANQPFPPLSRRMLLIGLVAALASPRSRAWSASGHRITGEIATALLTPAARGQLRPLIGSDELSLVANYMDEERAALALTYPGSPSWHYDDRPACAGDSAYAQYCPAGNCATAQVRKWSSVLADADADPAQRAFAVRLLVHVVSDLHQPLHAANNADQGGNKVLVLLPGATQPQKLHKVWDVDFVDFATRGSSEPAYAARLLAQYAGEIPTWQRGSVTDWAAETYALALQVAYHPLPGFSCNWSVSKPIVLPESYVAGAVAIIPQQLARAGARIAFELNSALDGSRAVNRSPSPAGGE
jgi:nuclease S1